MPKRKVRIFANLDWQTVLLYCLLLFVGWMNIYSADYNPEAVTNDSTRHIYQAIWIATAVALAAIILTIDIRIYEMFAYVFYAAVILLLVVTVFVAPDINGSHSWLVIGPLRIQPAEFAKFTTALAMAKYMSSYNFAMNDMRQLWRLLAILFLPMVCIILQREMGSALVFLALFLMLYREGMSGIVLLLGVLFVALFIVVLRFGEIQIADSLGSVGLFSSLVFVVAIGLVVAFFSSRKKTVWQYVAGGIVAIFLIVFALNRWTPLTMNYAYVALGVAVALGVGMLVYGFVVRNRTLMFTALFLWGMAGYCFSVDYIFENMLEYHQQTRIRVLLGMEDDPTGVGYNVNQSKIAIGSGGFLGKGFLEGTQTKLSYVPEQVTDFIFCNIGEEFGFVGSVAVLLLYMLFLFRLVHVAERQFTPFSRIYGYCVVSIFLFHLLINVGMVIGLMPVIGIPLPLISYGGSSLWGFTILLFVFLKLDASRSEQLH